MSGSQVEPARFPERPLDAESIPASGAPRNFSERGPYRAEQLVLITSAIADAVTQTQVFDAVVDEVAAAVGAETAALWTSLLDEPTATLARSVGYSESLLEAFSVISLANEGQLPVVDVMVTGEPQFIACKEDLFARYPHLADSARETPYRIACLPIEVDGRAFAVLTFSFAGSAPFDEEERSFLRIVVRHSGQALERLRLLEAEHRARVRAELLVRLAGSIIQAERASDVFEAALDVIQRALHAERASVLLFDDEGVMRFRAHRGISAEFRRQVEGHSPWTRETRSAVPIIVPDVNLDAEFGPYRDAFAAEGVRGLSFFPLVSGGRVIGKLVVYYPVPAHLDAHELELGCAITNHVATAAAHFAAIEALQGTVHFNEMFNAILGHDLRNPLGGIMAAAQLAMRRVGGDELQKPLARIVNSAERMSRMIEQLLDFTRVRVGAGIPLRPALADLEPLLRQVVEELTDANPDWTFRVDCSGDTTGTWDADRLAQVFSNLLGNAVQHGNPQAGVRVTVRGTDPNRVLVEVHNEGTVPSELLPKLFEPMTGGRRRRDKSIGLGLGLFITRQIAAAHGGSIEVRSSPASGTALSVSLPRMSPVPRPEPDTRR